MQSMQAMGVRCMSEDDTSLHGGILGDGCGLGKTLTALAGIWFAAAKQEARGDTEFRSTLVVCRAPLVDTWIDQVVSYFGDALTLRLYHGNVTTVRDADPRKERIIDNLGDWMDSLDIANPQTARTLILTSYQTPPEFEKLERRGPSKYPPIPIEGQDDTKTRATYACAATGLNLHAHYAHVLLFESTINLNGAFQAVDRMRRLGQRDLQRAYLPVMDHTCQWMQKYNNMMKHLPGYVALHKDTIEAALAVVERRREKDAAASTLPILKAMRNRCSALHIPSPGFWKPANLGEQISAPRRPPPPERLKGTAETYEGIED
ncbi:hypothetical protein N7474_003742 [Penicillium riverlandense]|uniref:uncharacterized protein n=1 Tax=Penicillium riverlandense TaxID=1903569 RepID=UPI0025498EBA|nr:uncharacterized protein N7474_003742 [Penicillium riverlandense]KAJ5818151.1 hypothetical protein N7474_003742 [Penicillium riverlandense]